MNALPTVDLVVIGGTGVYQWDVLEEARPVAVDTPFGETSCPPLVGRWGDHRVAFLTRHGPEHTILPHQVNFRANVWALAQLEPRHFIAIHAVGSLNPDLPPGALVLPDQIIDYTWGRDQTYATALPDVELYIDFTHPYCQRLHEGLIASAEGAFSATSAVLGITQGPRLETAAEVRKLGRDGCDLVGMTAMPEAALARELGQSYASITIVSNWAAGVLPDEPPISLDEVKANVEGGTRQLLGLMERFKARM